MAYKRLKRSCETSRCDLSTAWVANKNAWNRRLSKMSGLISPQFSLHYAVCQWKKRCLFERS